MANYWEKVYVALKLTCGMESQSPKSLMDGQSVLKCLSGNDFFLNLSMQCLGFLVYIMLLNRTLKPWYIYFCEFRNSKMASKRTSFLTFPACFSIPIIFSNLNYNCFNLSDKRNLQEQFKKAFCYQKLISPFTVWINCSSNLKKFANSQPSASYFKGFFSITRTISSHSSSEQFW